MQHITIHLTVQQKIDGQSETSSYRYAGSAVKKAGGWFLTYKEQIDDKREANTVLKISEAEVTLLRQGALQMKQVFQRGGKHRSVYQNPYGNSLLDIETNRLAIRWVDGQPHHLAIEYQLWLNEQYIGVNTLTLQIDWTDG